MITKVLKIEIKKPLNLEKSTFYQIMRDVQYNTRKMANRSLQMYWDFNNFNFSYKERFGKYYFEENNKLPNNKKVDADIIEQTSEFNKIMPSTMKDAIVRMVKLKWVNDLKDVSNANKSIASFDKKNLPIELHNKQFMDTKKNIRIYKEGKQYSTIINMLAKSYAKELGLSDGNFHLELVVKDNYQTAIVERVITGEYKLSMSKMQYDERKKKWFILLAYSFEAEKKVLNKNRILGIDLGVKIPAMCATSDNQWFSQSIGNSEEVRMFEQQVYNRKKRLQKSRIWAGEGSVGHGRKTRTKAVDKIGEKISNYKSTKNHCWSREIINIALREQCGVIQMEDLSGIAEDNKFLKTWTYFDLQQKIINKASEHGIEVIKINPKHTSGRCNKCGHIHFSNTKDKWRSIQDQFHCQICGHKANADANAARNIAMKGIEQIIEEQLKIQENHAKHAMKYLV